MRADQQHQRHQRCRAGADPVGERRDIKIDTLARIDGALTIERQMQAVFREQHMREQSPPRASTCDRAGACVIASGVRQESFSRTCWITFHWRVISSSVSVTSSPSFSSALQRLRRSLAVRTSACIRSMASDQSYNHHYDWLQRSPAYAQGGPRRRDTARMHVSMVMLRQRRSKSEQAACLKY
jgi:hypothetical protein